MRRSILPSTVVATPWSNTAFSKPRTITAGFLGKIERAVAAIDQIRHRLAVLELSDADRYRDLRKDFSGGATGKLTFGDRSANALGNQAASRQVRAGKN